MFKPLVLATSLFATTSVADFKPDNISLLLGSYHVDAKVQFNEVNPGVFLSWDLNYGSVSVGVYENSYYKTSVAATYSLPIFTQDDLSLSVFAGVAYYPEDGSYFLVHIGDVVPIGGLQATYKNLFVQVIPSDGVTTDAIVSFGLTQEF